MYCKRCEDNVLSLIIFQAPLNTPVTEDKFAILTTKGRIPVPILPGREHDSSFQRHGCFVCFNMLLANGNIESEQ